MSRRKTERLLSLVICLLATRRPLTAEQIRQAVPGYDRGGDEAFKRMFERDKDELRDLGMPLETGARPLGGRARLPDQAAGLRAAGDHAGGRRGRRARPGRPGVAAGQPGRGRRRGAAEAARGRRGHRRGQRQPGRWSCGWTPATRPSPRCGRRCATGAPVTFDYRGAGGAERAAARTVEPWGVVSRRGRWYVAGSRPRPRRAPGVPAQPHQRARSPRRPARAPSMVPRGRRRAADGRLPRRAERHGAHRPHPGAGGRLPGAAPASPGPYGRAPTGGTRPSCRLHRPRAAGRVDRRLRRRRRGGRAAGRPRRRDPPSEGGLA